MFRLNWFKKTANGFDVNILCRAAFTLHVQTLIFHFIQMRLCSQCTEMKKKQTHRMRAPLVGTIMSSSFLLVSLDEKRKINFKSITMWCAVHLMRKIHGKNPHEWERHRSGKYGSSQNHIYQSSLHDSNFYEIPISPLYQIIFYQNDISNEHVEQAP